MAIARGVVVVAAMGNAWEYNQDVIPYPASLDGVIGVAAVTRHGQPAAFSNRGAVDVAAPGEDIGSTSPTYPVPHTLQVGNPPGANLTGTSMAAPIVTGIVARMLSWDPQMSAAQVLGNLKGELCGCSADEVGIGRVDAEATMQHL